MLNIEYSNQSKKFLKNLDKNLSKRIVEKIEELKTNPAPHKAVRVKKEGKTFRIRVGDYRILYEIFYDKKVILISKIDKRARVY